MGKWNRYWMKNFPKVHNDWQCMVHPDRDRLGDLVEVTKKYSEVEVPEMIRDYSRVKKIKPFEPKTGKRKTLSPC